MIVGGWLSDLDAWNGLAMIGTMKKRFLKPSHWVLFSLLALSVSLTRADDYHPIHHPGFLFIPDSSQEQAGDVTIRAHTNHLLLVPDVNKAYVGTAPSGETPQSLRSVYSLPGVGGSGTIAIVDAYDYGTALKDFNVFSKQFGLFQETSTNVTANTNQVFQVVYASGRKPQANASWNQEAALDIEWSHAMAPNAKIVLVEANSSSFSDLFAAVKTAASLPGVKEVSMSWGGSEFSGELSDDSTFSQNGVVYFASAGDTGGKVIYPGTSPKVVSAGGTTVNRDSSGNFLSETAWSSAGGGPSAYEAIPTYQSSYSAVAAIVGSKRGTPDFSFDANPNTGVSVYDSTPYGGYSGWMVFGGTSVASPSLAGIVNLANSNSASSTAELTLIYSHYTISSEFRDITSGSAGKYPATMGWDFATGVGSNLGMYGK